MSTVVNNIQNLQVNIGDDVHAFPKHTCRISVKKNVVTVRDVADDRGEILTLSSNDVTSPSEKNNKALALTLMGYLSTGVGAISSIPGLDIATNTAPGWSTVGKFGENPDIDGATFETIWDGGGIYLPPTVARIHNVKSDNVADAGTILSSGVATGGSIVTIIDTGATFVSDGVIAGDVVLNDSKCEIGIVTAVTSETILNMGLIRDPDTGEIGNSVEVGDSYRVVTKASTGSSIFYVKGLSGSFLRQNEFVVLNGTSDVETVNSYIRQSRGRAFGADSTGFIGVVTSTAQIDLTISCQVIDGNNQSLMAIDTIPFGKTGYITKWWGSLSKKANAVSTLRLRAGTLDGIGYIIQPRSINEGGKSDFEYEFTVPIPGGPGVDIWIESNSDTPNTGISAGFDLVLKDL